MNWTYSPEDRVKTISVFLRKRAPKTYYDFSFEMPNIEDLCMRSNYLGAVVALDYGFWRLEKGKLNIDYYLWHGTQLKGANFLWTKSKSKLSEDPTFFTAERLANLTKEDFQDWLKDDSGNIPFKDPNRRYSLILDFGRKLSKVESLQKAYQNAEGNLESLIYFMEGFHAYSDFPFFKKAHLLCKIMERIGQWKMVESNDFKKLPPIDYHLMNIAWKLGIVVLPPPTEQKLANYELLTSNHEFLIRFRCAEAYQRLASQSGLDPYMIDDIMWMESRKNCQKEPYSCTDCLFDTVCSKNKTGFPLIETFRY